MQKISYSHVHESFRDIVLRSNQERIEFIDQPRWIGYSKANQLLDLMQGLLNRVKQHRMPNLLVTGESNNGKTTVIRQFVKKFGQSYIEDDIRWIMPVISIQSPPAPNEKELYISILEKFAMPYRSTSPTADLRYQLIHTFTECGVKLLIIDEIHSLLTGTARQQRQIMNCLKFLCNELEIPIVLAGTKDAVRILHTDPQHASRFDVAELAVWSNNLEFKRMVGSFERILPLKQSSNLTEIGMLNLIHTISDGKIGNVKRLLNDCAIEAIRSGAESITEQAIKDKSWLRPSQGIRKVIG